MEQLSTLCRNCTQAVSFIIKAITHICRDLDKRTPGSEGERKAGEYFHTRRDSLDNLDRAGLENCYRVTLRFIEMMDEAS